MSLRLTGCGAQSKAEEDRMPERQRIDMARDLTPAGYAIAEPLIAAMMELEQQWVRRGDEKAYQEWRETVTKLQAVVNEYRAGAG